MIPFRPSLVGRVGRVELGVLREKSCWLVSLTLTPIWS